MAGSDTAVLPKPASHPHRPPRPPRPQRPPRPPLAPPRRPRNSDAPTVPPYLPPFRQKRLALAHGANPPPPGSPAAQRAAWAQLAKAVHGTVNRVSIDSVPAAAKALLRLNVFRARGLLCKTLLRAQLGSPALAPVLAALVAVVNSRAPLVVALLVARLVAQLRDAYATRDRAMCFATARFVACLYNHQVLSELLVLEFLLTCLVDPSDGSVELAVGTLAECAPFLADRAPKACEGMFQRLREVLHDGQLGRRAQVMIEKLMARRRRKFEGEDVLDLRLDLVEEDEIITHFASLEDEDQLDLQEDCNAFQFDPDYEENEIMYEEIKKDILGADCHPHAIRAHLSADADGEKTGGQPKEGGGLGTIVKVDPNQPVGEKGKEGKDIEKPKDMTDAELVDFRRTIYLTFSSGLSYEEWAHKLTRLMRKNGGKELELCKMIVECCSQEKTFYRTYGLLGQRFCLLNKIYATCFEETFATHYATIHRFDTRKIRNIASFYASLLASEALPWNVMQVLRVVEEETTSSSRIFLKILFQEMAKTLGSTRLTELCNLPTLAASLQGVFPTDSAPNARFSINFFSSIDLGFLTEALREKLTKLPNKTHATAEGSDSSTLSSSSLSSSSLSSSSLSASSGEENERGERHSIGSKRANEQTSPAQEDRPSKVRRRSFELATDVGRSDTPREDGTSLRNWRDCEDRNSTPQYDSYVGNGRGSHESALRKAGRVRQRASEDEGEGVAPGKRGRESVDRERNASGRLAPTDDSQGGPKKSRYYEEPRRAHHSAGSSKGSGEDRDGKREDREQRFSRSRRSKLGENSRRAKSPSRRYYSDSSSDSYHGSSHSDSYDSAVRDRGRRVYTNEKGSDSDSESYYHSRRRRNRRRPHRRRSKESRRIDDRLSSYPRTRSPEHSYRASARGTAHAMSESSYSSREDDYRRRSEDAYRQHRYSRKRLGPERVIRKRSRCERSHTVRGRSP